MAVKIELTEGEEYSLAFGVAAVEYVEKELDLSFIANMNKLFSADMKLTEFRVILGAALALNHPNLGVEEVRQILESFMAAGRFEDLAAAVRDSFIESKMFNPKEKKAKKPVRASTGKSSKRSRSSR